LGEAATLSPSKLSIPRFIGYFGALPILAAEPIKNALDALPSGQDDFQNVSYYAYLVVLTAGEVALSIGFFTYFVFFN
jgi:hypothetical protein